MAVVNTGASIFQANISKLRRPLDTLDLEELLDSAPVLWLSCEVQIDVLGDVLNLSAILDRQDFRLPLQLTLRTKKAESFSPQLIHGFWHKLKE